MAVSLRGTLGSELGSRTLLVLLASVNRQIWQRLNVPSGVEQGRVGVDIHGQIERHVIEHFMSFDDEMALDLPPDFVPAGYRGDRPPLMYGVLDAEGPLVGEVLFVVPRPDGGEQSLRK